MVPLDGRGLREAAREPVFRLVGNPLRTHDHKLGLATPCRPVVPPEPAGSLDQPIYRRESGDHHVELGSSDGSTACVATSTRPARSDGLPLERSVLHVCCGRLASCVR